jgi:hypothetical protein
VKLLLDPKASDLHERHAAAIARLCRRAAGSGFAIADLPRVQLILDTTLPLLLSGTRPSLAAPLCDTVRLLGRPLAKCGLSDEARLPAALAGVLGSLGAALTAGAPAALQLAAAEALEALASAYHNRPSLADLRPRSGQDAVWQQKQQPQQQQQHGVESGQEPKRIRSGNKTAAVPEGTDLQQRAHTTVLDGDIDSPWRVYHLHQRSVESSSKTGFQKKGWPN